MNLSEKLILSDNPIDLIWNQLKKIYFDRDASDVQKYYKETELQLLEIERFLLKSYFEIYQKELIEKTENNNTDFLYEIKNKNTTILMMDALSIRELGLLFNQLNNKYEKIKFDYSFSVLPSETEFFRESINYKELKKEAEFYHLKEYNSINLSGNENFIWSRYPDILIEDVRSGQSLKNDLKEIYNKLEKIIFEVLSKLDWKRIIITSDHGYIRTESSYNISIDKPEKKLLRKLFNGSRFAKKDDSNNEIAKKLKTKNLIAETDNFYLPISHYSWPIPGGYSTFSH
ncbi:MAG: hypothetical protein ACOCUI_05715, partial [bacterium]